MMTTTQHLDTKPARVRKSKTPADQAPVVMIDVPKSGSKIATVIALLRRDGGATLAEMVAASGWLPHTTRAALTGLRKKGHAIVRGKRDDVTVYTLTAVA